MTTSKPTQAAMRAAEAAQKATSDVTDSGLIKRGDIEHLAMIIDRETGLPELIEALAMTLCHKCKVLIGWNYDWQQCEECSRVRAALAKARG